MATGSAGAGSSVGTTASVGIGASSVPVSSAASAAAAYCAASTLASSPALDQELRLQEERCGSIAPPRAAQPVHDQLERAQPAFRAPVAALHEERVQVEICAAHAVDGRDQVVRLQVRLTCGTW